MKKQKNIKDRVFLFAKILKQLVAENGLLRTMRFSAYRLARVDTPVHLNVGGLPLMLRATNQDFNVAWDCIIRREFQELVRYTSPLDIKFVIDAGGYIGTSAIVFANIFPNATIVSLEPSYENFVLLCQNVRNFRNIVPFNVALVSSDREVVLYDRGTGHWGFTIYPGHAERPLKKLHSVPGVCIQTLMDKFEKKQIDVLKMDIEGGEKEILSNSERWLPITNVVIAELHDRIVPGCSTAFELATEGMTRERLSKDKRIALRQMGDVSA